MIVASVLIVLAVFVFVAFVAVAVYVHFKDEPKVRYGEEMFGPTGAWTFSDKKNLKDHHFFDRHLAWAIVEFFKKQGINDVYDLGCGDGRYCSYFSNFDIHCLGMDGNPDTFQITEGNGIVADLTQPIDSNPRSWVISLEVGEHIPAVYEQEFLNNVARLSRKGVILSWAVPNQGGLGHVNCRDNEWVIREMRMRGFHYDAVASRDFRNVARIKWFKHTIMVFTK